MDNLLMPRNQVIVSNSEDVSTKFGKRHDNVVRDIDSFKNHVPDFEIHFFESLEKRKNARPRRVFYLTEVGLKLIEGRYTNRKKVEASNILYIIKHVGFSGFYKIGITYDMERRIKQHSTSSPLGLEVILQIGTKKAKKIETDLHEKYKDKRRNGEWFELSESEVSVIVDSLNSKRITSIR